MNREGNGKTSWDAEMTIVNSIEVIIPIKLLLVCNHIASKVQDNEFSIVTDIIKKTPTQLRLAEDFYIPKQMVSRSSIDYLPDSYSHNVCIHRHPNGLDSFSGTDKEYINQNFELSLLYTRSDGFTHGVYNHKLEDSCIIQLPVLIRVDYNIEEIDIANINVETDLFRSDTFLDDNKQRPRLLLEKFNGKDKLPKKDDPLEEIENRLFMLEEAVFYNNPIETGHF